MIYKETLEANKARILKLLRLDKIREELLIMAARRVGKTTCIAVIVAALMIVVPNSTGAIFSLALRASKRLMKMIRDTLMKHPKGAAMLAASIMDNSEQIILVGDQPSHIKVLYAFPDISDVRLSLFLLPFKCFFNNCNLSEKNVLRHHSSGCIKPGWVE